jgi:hypothetical protein
LYVATVAFGCFISTSGVTHGMHMRSDWRRRRRPRAVRARCWALARKPNMLGARSLTERVLSDASAPNRMSRC